MKATRKYLEHTADILFQAEAETLPELFEQCALAVEESQVDVENFKPKEKVIITGENNKIDLLLFDFLDDLLMYKDSELLMFCKFDIKIEEKISESEECGENNCEGKTIYHLTCTAYGEKIDHEKHDRKVDIKAITLHLFEVKKVEGGWKAKVLLDI
ncbi:MAG: archease [archaeon]